MIQNILFHTYQTLDDANVTSLAGLLSYVSDAVPIFVPMLLFTIYVISGLASYFSQQRLTGEGDLFASLASAGLLTFVVSIIMSLIPNFINITYVIICLVVAIVGGIIYFFSQDKQ